MKIFNDKNIIEIEKEDIKDAKLSSLDIADQTTRKRAFLNILGGRIAMKYLFSQKLDANNLYSLYTIHNILKNIDISDIYCNNIHADVRIVFNEEELFIPKSHEENEIYPDVYLIFKLNNSVTSATFLGYIEPKNINKNNENRDYYFVELDELKNPETIKTFLNNFSPEERQITQEEVTQAESFFLTVTDTEISKKSLKVLLHTLLYNYDLREKLVEFENFEFLSKKIATDETLGQDNLLGIVGTQELYKDEENEEKTQQEEKAEVIEEVLSDLIETKELENEAPVNNAETEDFLNELTSETEESANDDTKTSKNNTGEFLKDAGIALAGTAGVIAAGAIAANAAENVIGEITKDTAQGATEALISGVADVAGSVTDAVVNNIKNSSEDILKDNNIELPEEILDDTLSDLDLDEIENNFSDNIEENTETIEEVENIDNVEDIEEIENIDDIEDIENVKDDEEPENIDDIEEIEEINDIEENTPLDIEESSIDNDIDNLDIQEFEIDENSNSENDEATDLDDFESLFEETTDTKDEELDIQEFEIDEEVETDEISNDVEILDDVVEDFNNEEDFDNAEIEETIDEIPEEIPVKKQEQNNVETNELNNGFDNSLQPLGMIGSEDFSEGLMPLGSLEPIEDLGFGNNNNETYGYRPSAPMLDEEYENSLDNNGSDNEYRPSAPMLDTEDEEENDDLENNQETWTEEDENEDVIVEDIINEIEEENIIDEAILDEAEAESFEDLDIVEVTDDDEIIKTNTPEDIKENEEISNTEETESFEDLDIVEVTNDDEIIETNTSKDIEENEEISDTEEDLDIVNVVEDSNEEDINLDDISIEEVHNEFDPESPLANTGAEPVFEGITNVEMGFNNDTPDYMKDIQGVETKQSEIVNLDEISEDVMANTDSTESAIEEDNIQTDLDSIMNTENTTSESGDWGDINDILNETENLDTSDINLDDNSLMEEMTSGIDNNINTDDVNLDDINTSDALISDIDNFLSNINSPEEASNPQPATTTAYSNEEPKEAEEQEDGTLKLLFKEGRTPEIPNLFPSFTKFVNKVKSDKKMMVAASLACVVATSLIVGTIIPKNNDNVAQDSAQEMIDNNQMANSNEQNDVLTEQDAQNLGMDSQYQNEGVEQQSSLAENTQMDSGQVMSSAFSNEPVNTNITKIAWEISEDLAYNDAFRKYLQMAGKNLKINIQNELLLLNELAYSDSVIINLSLDQSGNLKNTTIQKSSGSKKIDKLVLQCVKDTMKYLKVPTDEIRKSGADATLIINF